MTVSQIHGYSAYREARVNEYDQSELILMMYSGAVEFLDKALAAAKSDPAAMSSYLSKAKNVILELMSSLNLEDSGEVGKLLLNTYSHQFHTLHVAQMTDNIEKVSMAWKDVFESEEYLTFKQKTRRDSKGASFKG